MKLLITGVVGFIGSHLAERLVTLGHTVTGVDNFSDYYDIRVKEQTANILIDKGIRLIRKDLNDFSCYDLLHDEFDYVFHLAAQPGLSNDIPFESYVFNNIYATQNLIDFVLKKKKGCYFINISTSSVYGLIGIGNEHSVPQPISFYGVTKLAAEELVLSQIRMQKIKGCSLRLYSVYGPRERPEKLYSKLITCILQGREFTLYKGSEGHTRSFTYVDDIVDGIVGVVDRSDLCHGEIINLGSHVENTTLYGIQCVEALLGKKAIINTLPARAGEQLHTKANIEKARKLLNYEPKSSLIDGLSAQVEWIRRNYTNFELLC